MNLKDLPDPLKWTGPWRGASWTMTGTDPGVGLMNMNDREHHRVTYVRNAAWKDAAFWQANRFAKPRIYFSRGPCEVWVDFGVKDPERRRDPHNFFKTVKPILDGLTMARLWPDDSSQWVHANEPRFIKSTSSLVTYTVTITWEEPDV